MGFAQRLKEAMDNTHTTMYRLSKILKVHPTTIKNWLDGKSEPKSSTIEKIATALEIDVTELLDAEPQNMGNRISKWRSLEGITIEDLSHITGIDQNQLKAAELNEIKLQIEEIEKIAMALSVTVDYLIGRTIKPNLISVPVDRNNISSYVNGINKFSYCFYNLNEKGQQVAIERIEELTKIPDYQKDKTV